MDGWLEVVCYLWYKIFYMYGLVWRSVCMRSVILKRVTYLPVFLVKQRLCVKLKLRIIENGNELDICYAEDWKMFLIQIVLWEMCYELSWDWDDLWISSVRMRICVEDEDFLMLGAAMMLSWWRRCLDVEYFLAGPCHSFQ